MSTLPAAEEARALATLWSSMARRHVSMGSACSCGIGGVTLQLQSYEQDIVDYVVAEAEKRQRPDVLDFLERQARADADSGWKIPLLLTHLEAAGVESDIAQFILERLGRTLHSFAEMHGDARG